MAEGAVQRTGYHLSVRILELVLPAVAEQPGEHNEGRGENREATNSKLPS
jgi:hypothetical protein